VTETIEAPPVDSRVRVLLDGLAFPEGPAFDPDGTLWCSEIRAGNLVRYDASGPRRFASGGRPNGVTFDASGVAWTCDAEHSAIRCFDPRSETWTIAVDRIDGEPLARPNDLAFDSAGTLVFTCPGNSREQATGYVCAFRPDGSISRIGDNLQFPNGLAFVDGGASLVVAETFRQRLWKGAWDAATATWIDPRPYADVGGPIGPDGMALDAQGVIWVGRDMGGRVWFVASEGCEPVRRSGRGRQPAR
jgi:gluconolactonase